MKISLIASSVRPWLWDEFFKSLEGNSDYEVVFSGNLSTFQVRPYLVKYPMLKYIHTADCICPSQCYEICRRNSTGDLIMWVCDDAEFSIYLLDKVCKFYYQNPRKTLISVRTNENNMNNDLDDHRLIGGNKNMPLMSPLGIMSREYLEELGGFDRRYVCGQYENDVAMRVWVNGGQVIKYEEACVHIEHLKKHGAGTKFWSGYPHDRSILESTWLIDGIKMRPEPILVANGLKPPYWYTAPDYNKVSDKPLLPFEPYSDENLLTVSQCPIKWPIDK